MARNVQVVLTEDLPNVGNSGELVRVKPGYARNFLIPRGLAALATKHNVKQIEHEKRTAQKRALKLRGEAEQMAATLAGVTVKVEAQSGEEDKLYGSITSRDVEEALVAQGFEIDRRKLQMEPIKELGTTEITIKIAAGVDATIKVEVVAKS